jgi:hypothetical protein
MEAVMSTIAIGNTRQARESRTSTRAPHPGASAPLRLTRRGKVAILLVAAIVIGLLAVMMGPSSTATGEAGAPVETTSVRVLPGHTLWDIAAAANPDGDIRATVDKIIELNSLPNASALQMGSKIAVPVYDK